jgi:hypothetical protein
LSWHIKLDGVASEVEFQLVDPGINRTPEPRTGLAAAEPAPAPAPTTASG